MSAERLFQIVSLLLERERMTADALAQELGVSARTVYRDVDALSAAGVPVCTTLGKGGGVALMESCAPDPTAFGREEQRRLLDALRGIPDQSEEQAVSRLAILFRSREEDWLYADLSRWGSSGQENECFHLLRRAIGSRREVCFVYCDPNEPPNPRHVLPVRLAYLDHCWCLQGYDREKEEFRLFRLSRMQRLSVSADGFRRRLDAPELRPGGDIPPLFRTQARLKFPPAMEHLVFDEFSGSGISVQADGSLVVSAVFFEEPQLYRYLLSFGPGLEVLSPLSLRERLAALAREIAQTNDTVYPLGEGHC